MRRIAPLALPLLTLSLAAGCGPTETLRTIFEGGGDLEYATLADADTLFLADGSDIWRLDLPTEEATLLVSQPRDITNLVSGFGTLAWLEVSDSGAEIWATPQGGSQQPFLVAEGLQEGTEIAVGDDAFYWLDLRELWTGGADMSQTSMVEFTVTDDDALMIYPLAGDLTVVGDRAWFKVSETYEEGDYSPLWSVSLGGGAAERVFEEGVELDRGFVWVYESLRVADAAWMVVGYTATATTHGIIDYDLYTLGDQGAEPHSELGEHYRSLAALGGRMFQAHDTDVRELSAAGTWDTALQTNATISQLFPTSDTLYWTSWDAVMATAMP